MTSSERGWAIIGQGCFEPPLPTQQRGRVEDTAGPRLPYLIAGVVGKVDENQAAARGRKKVRRISSPPTQALP